MDSADDLNMTDMAALLAGRLPGKLGAFGDVLAAWRAAAGAQLAARCVPTRLRDGELRVRCDSSVWVSELLHDQRELIARLQRERATHDVVRIAPYAGRVTRESEAPIERPALEPLDPADVARIDAMVASIADAQTRASVRRAAVKSAQRRHAGW